MVEEAERYIAKWSTSGIASAMITVIAIAKGDGPIREDNQLCGSVQGMVVSVRYLVCEECSEVDLVRGLDLEAGTAS